MIDADSVKQNILEVIKKQGGKSKDLIPVRELPLFIDIQPTAYSVDKVVEDVRCRCYELGLDESQTEIIVSEIVKQGGVSDDVCEWKVKSNYYVTKCSHDTEVMYGLKQDFKFCPYCGKKIKVVE